MNSRLDRVLAAWKTTVDIPPGLRRAVLWMTGPMVALGLGLKVHRIVLHPGDHGLVRGAFLLGGELLAYLGFALAALGWLSLTARFRLAWLGLLSTQAVAAATVVLGAFAHGYYLTTGFSLDYEIFAFSVGRLDETAAIVASEVNLPLSVLLTAMLLCILVPPWISRDRPAEAVDGRTAAHTGKTAWVHLLLGCGLVALSVLPRSPDTGRAFFREPSVALVSSGLYAYLYPAPYGGSHSGSRPVGPSAALARPEAGKLNLVVVFLESTRAQATTPYNPELSTTPFLAELAEESLLVQRAYAVVPHTSKALGTTLCGFEPAPSREVVGSHKSGMTGRCLASLLRDHGYTTAYFQSPKKDFERRPKLVKNMGFDHFWSGDMTTDESLRKINYFGYGDEVMLEPNRRWLQEGAKEPFLAVYLTNTTHHPYSVPDSFEKQTFSRKKKLNDYLNTIAYTDQILERLVTQYRDAGLWDRTVFIVLGDHGEGFGEHGLRSHDNVMYEEGIAVPLVIRAPGHEAAAIPGPVNQLAVVPTALDLLGYDVAEDSYVGASVLELPPTKGLQSRRGRNAKC